MTMTDPKTLKNDTERKAWLRNYQGWPLWYMDKRINVTYYRYKFENGAELIADEYIVPGNEYMESHGDAYRHLVGGPKVEGCEMCYHETFQHYPDSETYLCKWLKTTKGGSTDGSQI